MTKDPADFWMPFGQYRGKKLREIAQIDVLYLDWLNGLPDLREPLKSAVGEMCRRNAHNIEKAIQEREAERAEKGNENN